MKFPQGCSRSMGATWRILLFLAALLPVRAFAHEGENKGPWIDFSQYGFDGITQMMNAHPAFVHFPIALLPAILVFYCLGTWLKWPSLLIAGRATLYLAFLSLIIVVYTGLRARSAPSNEAIEAIMQTHKNTGFVIMGVVTLLVLWSFWTVNEPPAAATGPLRFSHKPVGNWAYLLVVALAAFLVLQNADLGGKMVYMHGAAVKPMVPLIEASKGPAHDGAQGSSGPATPSPAPPTSALTPSSFATPTP